jgi:hypothetical protein
MRLLLDTHTFLWWVQDAPTLSAKAHAAIAIPSIVSWPRRPLRKALPLFLPITTFEDTE